MNNILSVLENFSLDNADDIAISKEVVGILSLTPDNKLCAFEYDKAWLVNGFSISPLE